MNHLSGYVIFFLVLCIASCSPSETGKDFYYPVDELADGMVYAYESVGAMKRPPHYWFHRSIASPDSLMMTSTYYSHDFEPRQFLNERIVGTGSLMRDFRLFTPTDSSSISSIAEVMAPALFSFEGPDTGRILVNTFSFRQNPDQDSSALYTLTRNRRYLKDTLFTLSGKPIPSQLWAVKELTEQDSLGVLAIETQAIEIYSKGIGLTYRERIFSDGSLEAYRLAGRFSMDSLTVLRDASHFD